MQTIIQLVLKEVQTTLQYLPTGCQISLVITLLMTIIYSLVAKKKKVGVYFKMAAAFLFIAYIYCVLQITIFSRTPGNYGDIDWRILAKWQESTIEKVFFIANVIMCIPLGILLPTLARWLQHLVPALSIAVLFSVGIEAVQLIFQRGFCQLDDVFSNTIGFLIGYLCFLFLRDIYLAVAWVCKRLKRRVSRARKLGDENIISKISGLKN